MYQLQANGKRGKDVFNPRPVRSPPGAAVDAGDPKVTMNYSESYTLGNGWEPEDTFEVYARATAWAINNKARAEAQECSDEGYDTYTIPIN